jgi:hypothetical protein
VSRSALNPFRLETLEHRLRVKLAARRVERERKAEIRRKGWRTRRENRCDPLIQQCSPGGNAAPAGATMSRSDNRSTSWMNSRNDRGQIDFADYVWGGRA